MNKRKRPKYKESYVAFVDVLGFGPLVEASADPNKGPEIIDRINYAIKDSIDEISGSDSNFMFTQFSDSFVLSLASGNDEFSQHHFSHSMHTIIDIFLREGMALRGGITFGPLIHQKQLLMGPALNRAYFLESKVAVAPRIIFDNNIFTKSDFEGHTGLFDEFEVAVDGDGYMYLDYIKLRKAWYLSPGWLVLVKDLILKMPTIGNIGEKRKWMIKKYNHAVSEFSISEFEKKWEEYTSDADANNFVLMDEKEILKDARSLTPFVLED